jgi:hypothetical protein
MKQYTGSPVGGSTMPQIRTVWFVANKETGPPIKHEFMHMITISSWGPPLSETDWMKEGIAAYAENSCNGFNVEQIYAFLEKKNMLIPMDSLTANFYGVPEMIAYHQSAYICQYLFEHFGILKFRMLWQSGLRDFEKIFGIPFLQIQSEIKKKMDEKYPQPPNIDWDSFKTGCN